MEMKESGIKWIGKIPKGWNVTKIKFLCEMKSGDNITAQDINSEKDEINCYKVYGANGFRGYYKKYTHNGRYCLVGRQGALAGNVHITDGFFWATDHAIVVYVNNKISQEYMYYLLISMNLNQYAFETAAQPGLAVSKIMNLQVVCPPCIQQQIILEYLNKKCAEINALSSDIQIQINILEDYKKSVITETVTNGLNPNVEMKDSGIEWIGEIPSLWSVHPIYYYFGERKNKNIFGFESNLLSLSYGHIVRKNISSNEGLLPESFNTYNIVEKNDIIIRPTDLQNDKRSLRTGLVKERGIITSAYISLKAKKEVNAVYFHYLLYTYDIMKVFYNMGNGVRQGLNFSEFSKLLVIAPSIEEQGKIVAYLDKKCGEIDFAIIEKKKQVEVLKQYKESLIYEYVTGKKEVIK